MSNCYMSSHIWDSLIFISFLMLAYGLWKERHFFLLQIRSSSLPHYYEPLLWDNHARHQSFHCIYPAQIGETELLWWLKAYLGNFGVELKNFSHLLWLTTFDPTRIHLEISINGKAGNIHTVVLTHDQGMRQTFSRQSKCENCPRQNYIV